MGHSPSVLRLRLRGIGPKYSQYGDLCIVPAGKNHRFLVAEPAFRSGRLFWGDSSEERVDRVDAFKLPGSLSVGGVWGSG